MSRRPSLCLVVSSLVFVACAGKDHDHNNVSNVPALPSSSAEPTSFPTPDHESSPEDVVRHPDVILDGVRLRRSRGDYDVTSLWRLPGAARAVLVHSDDGFETATFTAGRYDKLWRRVVAPRPANAPKHLPCAQIRGGVDVCLDERRRPGFPIRWTDDGGATWTRRVAPSPELIGQVETSLRPGTIASVRGGDGATLLPFELAVRSDDLGETWESFDLPRFDGQTAYVAQSVVTADGRLLALLNNFSDDRHHRPAARHHGLYASDGQDWSSYSPLRPDFSPGLTPAPRGWSPIAVVGAVPDPEPFIYVQTWDHRVYVSTDDAATFREIPVR